jgi:hypothetical protein
MSVTPLATVAGCYAIASLVPPRFPKLGLTNIKIKVHRTVLNKGTRSHVLVHVATEAVWVGGTRVHAADVTVVGQVVRARATVLCMHVWAPC